MMINSPFDTNSVCKPIEVISTSEIIGIYKDFFQIDVSRFFIGLHEITIHQCPITGLEFYAPMGLDGDGAFYNDLARGEWYYQTERWENEKSLRYISSSDRVLEIGSGSGFFGHYLKSLRPGVSYSGLELNAQAVLKGISEGINLIEESSNTHLINHANHYDVICSFQVFEHVSNIKQLYLDSIGMLKPGGVLLVAVPNNKSSYLRHNVMYSKVLNMPPHHVNLFTPESLRKIGELMGLSCESVQKEPLMALNRDTFLYNRVQKLFLGSSLMTRMFWKLRLHLLLRPMADLFKSRITGHTVLIAYRKPG